MDELKEMEKKYKKLERSRKSEREKEKKRQSERCHTRCNVKKGQTSRRNLNHGASFTCFFHFDARTYIKRTADNIRLVIRLPVKVFGHSLHFHIHACFPFCVCMCVSIDLTGLNSCKEVGRK